eukprot:m.2563 g.2563  ORF g.2563 m.2563 type:complete len:241 (+) comp2545_c0_seq2:85-807(+)
MELITPESLLVKYERPVLSRAKTTESSTGSLKRQTKLPPVEPATKPDFLSSIFPPKTWTEGTNTYTQRVSNAPPTREDVDELEERLDAKLKQRQARDTGICPVRRELYTQAFDEIIRQVALDCPERGLLLSRVRNEIQMTLEAYQVLYDSSVTFGMRKGLQSEQGQLDFREQIVNLEQQKKELEDQVVALKAKCEETERKSSEELEAQRVKQEDAFQFQKRTAEQLKAQLESLMAPTSKK